MPRRLKKPKLNRLPGPAEERPEELPPFARALKQARAARGWSQDELSDASGVDQGMISKYERGVMSPSKREVVERVARALASEWDDDRPPRLLNSLLLAAGLAPVLDPADAGLMSDPRFQVVREAFDNGSDDDRDLLASMADRVRRAQEAARAGAIGRRAADEDDDQGV